MVFLTDVDSLKHHQLVPHALPTSYFLISRAVLYSCSNKQRSKCFLHWEGASDSFTSIDDPS